MVLSDSCWNSNNVIRIFRKSNDLLRWCFLWNRFFSFTFSVTIMLKSTVIIEWFTKRLCNINILITFFFLFFFVESEIHVFIIFIYDLLFLLYVVLALGVLLGFLIFALVRVVFIFILFTRSYNLTGSRANDIRMSFNLFGNGSKWRFQILFMLSINYRFLLLLHNLFLLMLLWSNINFLVTFITIVLFSEDIQHFSIRASSRFLSSYYRIRSFIYLGNILRWDHWIWLLLLRYSILMSTCSWCSLFLVLSLHLNIFVLNEIIDLFSLCFHILRSHLNMCFVSVLSLPFVLSLLNFLLLHFKVFVFSHDSGDRFLVGFFLKLFLLFQSLLIGNFWEWNRFF